MGGQYWFRLVTVLLRGRGLLSLTGGNLSLLALDSPVDVAHKRQRGAVANGSKHCRIRPPKP
eukprot:1315812-Pyramimonas_sp.AAC.2